MKAGTLRDQIIYPHKYLQMMREHISDKDIVNLLREVKVDYLL